MIQLIVGEKGKGKTKVLLEKVNTAAASATGNVVFIDSDNSHMYELKNNIRLINSSEYAVDGADAFYGFLAGIVSADHDLQEIYVDRLLKTASVDVASVEELLNKLSKLFDKYDVKGTVSISISQEQVPAGYQDKVVTV